jgi:hypothetical protein
MIKYFSARDTLTPICDAASQGENGSPYISFFAYLGDFYGHNGVSFFAFDLARIIHQK